VAYLFDVAQTQPALSSGEHADRDRDRASIVAVLSVLDKVGANHGRAAPVVDRYPDKRAHGAAQPHLNLPDPLGYARDADGTPR
jgi:hypothetical protein